MVIQQVIGAKIRLISESGILNFINPSKYFIFKLFSGAFIVHCCLKIMNISLLNCNFEAQNKMQ